MSEKKAKLRRRLEREVRRERLLGQGLSKQDVIKKFYEMGLTDRNGKPRQKTVQRVMRALEAS